jgi:hypothetical protein
MKQGVFGEMFAAIAADRTGHQSGTAIAVNGADEVAQFSALLYCKSVHRLI